jgi:NAD(P)-dependent dehydrogenase (short-subunit alcohol dehydrogenase family)
MDLDGKNVVITGAARGIGREICAGFVQAGANVVAVDMRDLGETEAFVRGKQPQAKLEKLSIDLADPASVGREGGLHSLRFFTAPKNVCTREG